MAGPVGGAPIPLTSARPGREWQRPGEGRGTSFRSEKGGPVVVTMSKVKIMGINTV